MTTSPKADRCHVCNGTYAYPSHACLDDLAARVAKLEAAQWGASGPWACSVCGENGRRTTNGLRCEEHKSVTPAMLAAPVDSPRGGTDQPSPPDDIDRMHVRIPASEIEVLDAPAEPSGKPGELLSAPLGFRVVGRSGADVAQHADQWTVWDLNPCQPWKGMLPTVEWNRGEHTVLAFIADPPELASRQGETVEPWSRRLEGVYMRLHCDSAERAALIQIQSGVAALEAKLAAAEVVRKQWQNEWSRLHGELALAKKKLAATERENASMGRAIEIFVGEAEQNKKRGDWLDEIRLALGGTDFAGLPGMARTMVANWRAAERELWDSAGAIANLGKARGDALAVANRLLEGWLEFVDLVESEVAVMKQLVVALDLQSVLDAMGQHPRGSEEAMRYSALYAAMSNVRDEAGVVIRRPKEER